MVVIVFQSNELYINCTNVPKKTWDNKKNLMNFDVKL